MTCQVKIGMAENGEAGRACAAIVFNYALNWSGRFGPQSPVFRAARTALFSRAPQIKTSRAVGTTGGFPYSFDRRSCLPEAVQIAVGVDGLDLVALADAEADLGLVAGVQRLALIARLGLEGDPFDIVLREHRVWSRTDGDIDGRSVHFDNGHVLLDGGVGRRGDDLLHRFAAADHGSAGLFDDGDDLAAVFAAVELHFHGDNLLPVFDDLIIAESA